MNEGIIQKIMYIRMRQSMFLALSDVIDAFVVAGKNTKKYKWHAKNQTQSE